ncbi:hypothetical protein [Streptomyces sp. WAC01280]|uniref:hypothetical protein n=1 Tax=Streptomyces sp. WAC01280 TaxID=2487424 RepID=UPI000F76FF9F|nr:hypothetical protein [Streptomyces sp. WAC01280]RSS59584.1 hypothetical protein EF909_06820 [Streptomyces sp. WAC01280]
MAAIPQDLLDRFRALESRVRQLEGRTQIRPAMNEILDGDVVVGAGGRFFVKDPSGQEILKIGELYEETGEFGTVLRRDDGSIALSIYRGPGTPNTIPQALRLKDAGGREIFAEDTVVGGLARPYIPLPIPMEESTNKWPSTTSTSFTTIGRSNGFIQQPRARVYAQVTASGGATGQLRFLVNGTTVATATAGQPLVATFAVPSFTYGVEAEFELQARVSSGTGTAYGMTRYLYGFQS